MRVIAGELKGRKLAAPKGAGAGNKTRCGIRPTADRVKEAIFSMIHRDVEGAVCLDLFAGTGQVGIEALSRGADRVYFCDIDPDSLALLRQNLDICKIEGRRVTILAMDWRSAVAKLNEKCNLVFVDAPFDMCEYYSQMLEALAKQEALDDEALILIERDAGAGDYVLPTEFEKVRDKRYGDVGVDLLLYIKAGGKNERG